MALQHPMVPARQDGAKPPLPAQDTGLTGAALARCQRQLDSEHFSQFKIDTPIPWSGCAWSHSGTWPSGVRSPGSGGPGPTLGFGPPDPGRPVGQGTKGPGGPGPSGAADGPDRGHQFRDSWPGQVNRCVPGHGLEVGAASGPPGHGGRPNPTGAKCWDPYAEAQLCAAHAAQWDSIELPKPVVGTRPDSDHAGLPGIGAGPVGEFGLSTVIHALGVRWVDALPAVTGEH